MHMWRSRQCDDGKEIEDRRENARKVEKRGACLGLTLRCYTLLLLPKPCWPGLAASSLNSGSGGVGVEREQQPRQKLMIVNDGGGGGAACRNNSGFDDDGNDERPFQK